ncbi:MAG: helix-turn-helix transcriptional regulator [Woeseiaceae bacterium]
MIKCNLSLLMGRDKMKIIDVSRSTDLNRSTITALYNEEAKRVDLDAIDKLCKLFKCNVSDLFHYEPDD